MIGFTLLFAIGVRPSIPATLSLRQAIEIALRSSPALVRAAAQVRQAEAREMQSRSQTLPRLDFAASNSGQTFNLQSLGVETPLLPARGAPFQSVDARAYLSQDVLNLSVRDRDRAANEEVTVSQSTALDAREYLAFQVAVEFAQVLRVQSAVQTLDQEAALAGRLHSITLDRVKLGTSSLLDARRSEIQVQNLQQALLETRSSLAAGKLRLANLLHAEPSTQFELAEPEYQDVTGDPVARADYRAAEAAVRAADFALSGATRQRYPTISLRANYGQNGAAWNSNLNTFFIGGSVHIPIYSGGRIAGEVAEARAKLEEAKARLEELRCTIETEILSATASRDSAKEQLAVARRTVQLAKEEVALSTDRFTSGVADNTEVVDAQDRLARTEDNAIRAAFNLAVAQAQLKRALGVPQ